MLIELKLKYYSIPLITRFYLTVGVILSSIISICQLFNYKLLKYFMLDYNKVIEKYEFWRLFSNFFIFGKLGIGFLAKTLMIYLYFSQLERLAKSKKEYASFIMMIFYVCSLLLIIEYFLSTTLYLSSELLTTIIVIECQKNPEEMRLIWGLQMKGTYLYKSYYNTLL
jgi:Derlin-2/3